MNKSPKLLNSFSHIIPKAEPLTLNEVLRLRDGMEISRPSNTLVSQTIPLLSILKNINHLNSLN
jgi:hypothetical protein